MKRVWLIVFLASAFAASPPKKKTPEDYSSWNNYWFATCRGESILVRVTVDNPKGLKLGYLSDAVWHDPGKTPGSHRIQAVPAKGEGECRIGKDAPEKRPYFLVGNMVNGKIDGIILLCTSSQELAATNFDITPVFGSEFEATYDPQKPSISGTFKGEHWKKSGGEQKYKRDEPKDPEAGFEMHLWTGEHVTHHDESPQPTPTGTPASQANEDGKQGWYKTFIKAVFGVDY